MANIRSASEYGTFSKLFPESRRLNFQPLDQSSHRRMPDEYRCSASLANETSECSGATNRADLLDEMRAVRSTYTAYIEDQDLPSSAQDLYRLVANMVGKVLNEPDEHLDASVETVNAVRCIDRYVRETTSDLNTLQLNLKKRTDDNGLFRFHAHLADYAGAWCGALKGCDDKPTMISSQPWTIIVKAIDKGQDQLPAWEASDQHSARPHCLYLEALQVRVQHLVDDGWTFLDLDLALFAIRTYARRNYICHGGVFDLFKSNNFAGLAKYIEEDDSILEKILPDEEKPMVGKYRRLLTFYRDSHIRQDSDGKWVGKAPSSTTGRLLKRSSRPTRAETRGDIEMGLLRPPGLSGSPPANVSFFPTEFRRQSDPERRGDSEQRGLKRPANEQPPENRCVKAARGLDYPQGRLETLGTVTDQDSMGALKLLDDVLALGAELTYRSPSKSLQVLQEQMEELEKELEAVGVRIRKRQMKGSQKGRR